MAHRELQVFPDNPGMRWPLKFEMSILDLDKKIPISYLTCYMPGEPENLLSFECLSREFKITRLTRLE